MQNWVVLAIFGAEKGLFFPPFKINLGIEWSSKTSSHTQLNCVKYNRVIFHVSVVQLKLYFKGKLYKNKL